MPLNLIDVELVNEHMEFICNIQMPEGTIPMPNTKLYTQIDSNNKKFLVNDIIIQYFDKKHNNLSMVKITLIVTNLYPDNNQPVSLNPQSHQLNLAREQSFFSWLKSLFGFGSYTNTK